MRSPAATKTWRAAGSSTISASSRRFLAITLQLGGNESNFDIISAYGPTAQSDDDEKDKFFSEFQETLDAYKEEYITIILGDELQGRIPTRTRFRRNQRGSRPSRTWSLK